MDNNQQMKSDISKLIEYGMYNEAEQYIKLYYQKIGKDEEVEELRKELLSLNPPKVSLICIDCDVEYIDAILRNSEYSNLEVVSTESGQELITDIYEYVTQTDSRYICFLEPGQRFAQIKIGRMMEALEEETGIDAIICQRCFGIEGQKTVHVDDKYEHIFKDMLLDGKVLLEYCLINGVNLYGNLSTLMIRKEAAERQLAGVPTLPELSDMLTVWLNYHLLYKTRVAICEQELVMTNLEPFKEETFAEKCRQFICIINYFRQEKSLAVESFEVEKWMPAYFEPRQPKKEEIKKEITFFYTDKGEYFNLEPIGKEAEKRGYKVRFTEGVREKAEIGVYCQHVCFPENSKFSVILLHDMAQGHNRWPDIWNIERWNKFDVGILPGIDWAERWAECASLYYVQPRYGAYLMGYPKSDYANSKEIADRAQQLKQKMQLKYNDTVLYAPSWENDGKEHDFVCALASLPINLIIKQASWPKAYAGIIQNIEQMRKLHEGNYENVYYIEPEESIMVALKMCDLVVSDESSVMTEALMYGKPSVAVTDWLIPDTMPKRFASVPFDYVYKCKKQELGEYVENILLKKQESIPCGELKDRYFYNSGNCCEDIMDAVDYLTGVTSGGNNRFRDHLIKPDYMPISFWN